ncbi:MULTISPECIES: O-antigen ligase family protein [unclassified Pantoea]|uniref:O-antigen ligase family protein n=1 Tax=unclassified Pantoea TaxID=2630326 RepID=UPI000D3B1698|nr:MULTISPECIES: O-antigen ligase family protein [unclassified Pantoea]NIE72627.1 O-antigen ligase family protein [Pantoea sp. Acro-807]RAU30128.1 O-antigen ligase family protein [Pantoea sp. RIT 413]
MNFSQKNNLLERIASFSFMSFIFLLVIFTDIGKINNLFYISFISMALYIFSLKRKNTALEKINWRPYIFVGIFLFYYSLSNFWSGNPSNFFSTLKHSFYLLFVLYICNHIIKKHGAVTFFSIIFSASLILLVLILFMVNKSTLLSNRLEHAFFAAPSNVIDLGGYFAIGILSGLIVARESGKQWIYFLCALLFIGLILTQSRGPFFSLLIALAVTLANYRKYRIKNVIYITFILISICIFFFITDYGHQFWLRIIASYKQSFIRFGIWEHGIKESMIHPFFGWGFDKELRFVNSVGQHIATTHSVYVAAFLKGGLAGLALLFVVIASALLQAYKKFRHGKELEAALYIFSLVFISTQGMFVISGPAEMWILFWIPLAVVLPKQEK